jgi:hypothetical protein
VTKLSVAPVIFETAKEKKERKIKRKKERKKDKNKLRLQHNDMTLSIQIQHLTLTVMERLMVSQSPHPINFIGSPAPFLLVFTFKAEHIGYETITNWHKIKKVCTVNRNNLKGNSTAL